MQVLHDPMVMAALVAALVSILVNVVSALLQRRTAKERAEIDILSLKQAQLRDVMAQRMSAYPKLWSLLQSNVSNRLLEGKPMDAGWADDFLIRLNDCHASCGVFFSQSVYEMFFEFRAALIKIQAKFAHKQQPSKDELYSLEKIWSGQHGTPGLATRLKDDLGSYEDTVYHWTAPKQ
jgi:hypothetical protein